MNLKKRKCLFQGPRKAESSGRRHVRSNPDHPPGASLQDQVVPTERQHRQALHHPTLRIDERVRLRLPVLLGPVEVERPEQLVLQEVAERESGKTLETNRLRRTRKFRPVDPHESRPASHRRGTVGHHLHLAARGPRL